MGIRRFNGKAYTFKGSYHGKANVNHDKEYWKGRGYLTRVIPNSKYKGYYILYVRYKGS